MIVRILGIDPGWCATGFATVEWSPGERPAILSESMWTVETAPTPASRRESKVADDGRRIREIMTGTLMRIADQHPDIVVIEALSLGAPNVMSIVCQTKGYTAALSEVLRAGIAYREIAPQDVRRALGVPTGKKGEKKPEKKAAVQRAVLRLAELTEDALAVPEDPPHRPTEHEWDAAAVALACLVPVPIDLVLAVQAGRAT